MILRTDIRAYSDFVERFIHVVSEFLSVLNQQQKVESLLRVSFYFVTISILKLLNKKIQPVP